MLPAWGNKGTYVCGRQAEQGTAEEDELEADASISCEGLTAQLETWGDKGPVCYNEMVFAELAVKFDTQRELEHRLSAFTHLPSR